MNLMLYKAKFIADLFLEITPKTDNVKWFFLILFFLDLFNWYFYKTSATFGDIDEFLEIQVWLIWPTKYQLLFIQTVQLTRIVHYFFYPVHLQNMQLVATIIMAKSNFGKLCLKFAMCLFVYLLWDYGYILTHCGILASIHILIKCVFIMDGNDRKSSTAYNTWFDSNYLP